MTVRRLFLLTFAFSPFLLISCGPKSKIENTTPQLELTEVTGKVTVNGQAVAGVAVTSHPVDKAGASGMVFRGVTDETGAFSLADADGKKGATAGEHVLTFRQSTATAETPQVFFKGEPPADKLGGRFSDERKNLNDPKFKYTVNKGEAKVIPPIDLVTEAAPN